MKRLIAYLFKIPLVYTEDYDGEIRLRFVSKIGGKYRCDGILDDNSVILNKDMTTGGKDYVEKWYPANKLSEKLFN